MKKEEIRQAFKGSANAVRAYLATLGMTLSHTQALEVVARSGGMRSRHVLAQEVDAADRTKPSAAPEFEPMQPTGKYTRVSFGYIDGSNNKRFSSVTFRGALTAEQLKFIAHKLDDGMFFIPVQIGFESLHLAFTDDGGDDHFWHKIELDTPESWVLDAEGFVLNAGDVQQVTGPVHQVTDANCDNLVWRFARVLKWDESLQEAALTHHAYRRPDEDRSEEDPGRLVEDWLQVPELVGANPDTLAKLASVLLQDGFEPVDGLSREMRREVGPNAYQFCLLEVLAGSARALQANFDVSTLAGNYITETPVTVLPYSAGAEEVYALARQLKVQAKSVRSAPAAYDASFE